MSKISDVELMTPGHIAAAIERAYREGQADYKMDGKMDGTWEDSVAKIWSKSYSRIAKAGEAA